MYDVARSTAWFVNAARGARSWFPGKRPVANVALRVCHRADHRWTAFFTTTRELRLGDALFAPYGVGSSHHEVIAAEAAARRDREPVCNQRKRARREQLAQARQRRGTSDAIACSQYRVGSTGRHTRLCGSNAMSQA